MLDFEDTVIQKTPARTPPPPGFLLCELGPIDRKLEHDENMKNNYSTLGGY